MEFDSPPCFLLMRPTTTTYRFTAEEIEELKEKTNLEDGEKALERWAKHQYPIGKGMYVIGDTVINDEGGGKIEIVER